MNQSSAAIVHGRLRRASAASPAARTACSCGARFAVLKYATSAGTSNAAR